MAKLIIEINDGETLSIQGLQVDMKLDVSKKGQRTLSDLIIAELAKSIYESLPELTKSVTEQIRGRKIVNTEVKQGQTLSEALAAAQRKTH
ncbi:hypothetical protein ACROAH_14855 [Shewanella oncorhynchi]|uniref:hypothetical protein n=1 Tax=Shewanella TaxID=22 RepID=UPI0021DA7F1C|nr:hypothetical protein [Shewanella sp. SM103]MCU8078444.1 hypothetical protein [Shewanella sp. SM103]